MCPSRLKEEPHEMTAMQQHKATELLNHAMQELTI
jgi:hypothetical protein